MVALASAVHAVSISVSTRDAGEMTTAELVREFNTWINSLIFPKGFFDWAYDTLGDKPAHYLLTYIRNFVAGSFLYYFTAACWHW